MMNTGPGVLAAQIEFHKDKAFEWLEVEQKFNPLRAHPRLHRLLKRAGRSGRRAHFLVSVVLEMKPKINKIALAVTLSLYVFVSAQAHSLQNQERPAGLTKQGTLSGTEEELKRITQELLDAVAIGDRGIWDKYLADTCLYNSEDGRTLTKSQLLEELRPLPQGYIGKLRMANPQVREYGDTAIITYDAMEELEIYGQMIKTRFHTTDTYLRRAGQWQMIASQVLVVPGELAPVKLNPKLYDEYVGEYALAPGVTYRVRREGGRLTGQRAGREKEELLPESADSFFRRGTRGERIFVRDRRGRVIKMVDRRDNNDIAWKKIK